MCAGLEYSERKFPSDEWKLVGKHFSFLLLISFGLRMRVIVFLVNTWKDSILLITGNDQESSFFN